jgi:hypothetical protein
MAGMEDKVCASGFSFSFFVFFCFFFVCVLDHVSVQLVLLYNLLPSALDGEGESDLLPASGSLDELFRYYFLFFPFCFAQKNVLLGVTVGFLDFALQEDSLMTTLDVEDTLCKSRERRCGSFSHFFLV